MTHEERYRQIAEQFSVAVEAVKEIAKTPYAELDGCFNEDLRTKQAIHVAVDECVVCGAIVDEECSPECNG